MQKVTKPQVNRILKGNGLANVVMDAGNFKNKAYRDIEGKMVKGIRASSKGPMTVTSQWIIKRDEVLAKVVASLRDELGLCMDEHKRFKMSSTAAKTNYLTFHINEYPQYTRSQGYDDGYVNVYIVPYFYSEERF